MKGRRARQGPRQTRVGEREHDVAAMLDDMLLALERLTPAFSFRGDERTGSLRHAHGEWERAWRRTGVLQDDELLARIAAVGRILEMSRTDVDRGRSADVRAIERALNNARRSIAAFRREEDLPRPSFPSRDELAQLAPIGRGGRTYKRLHEWLEAHPERD